MPRLALALAALAVSLASTLVACTGPRSAMGDGAPLDLELPRTARPVHYALELALDERDERYQGTVAIALELTAATPVLWLHARGLELGEASVEISGAQQPATLLQVSEAGATQLRGARPLPPGRAVVRVAFSGPLGEGPAAHLARIRVQGALYALLATGPGGARDVFPCLDDPAYRTPFDLALVVPASWSAAFLAPVLSEAPAGPGRKRVRFATTAPLPTHHLLAAAGPFAAISARPVAAAGPREAALPLRALSPPGLEQRLWPLLAAARGVLPRLEALLDRAYPAGRIEVVLLPGLAKPLGAPGLVVTGGGFDDPLLALAREPPGEVSAGDAATLAAALSRAWFGGAAGAARWRDLWADEGLGGAAALIAAREWKGSSASEPEVLAIDRALSAQLLPGSKPLRFNPGRLTEVALLGEPSFRARAAALLAAWERSLGPGRFREALRGWLERPGAVRTGEELGAELSRAAGRDLSPALQVLAEARGVVRLDAQASCDAAGPHVELAVNRVRLPGSAWTPQPPAGGLPVCARFEAAGSLGEACTVMEGAKGALALPACPRWVMPAAGGAVPWRWLLAPEDRTRLREAGFLHLSLPERLAWAQGLRAAALAGELPMSEVLASLAPLARDGDPKVAEVAMPLLLTALEDLLPRRLLPRARARAADLYRPRLRELGLEPAPEEPRDRTRLRRVVAELLAVALRDPETSRGLAARARGWLGLGGEPARPEGVSFALLPAALAAAVDEGGTAVFDALESRLLASPAPSERALLVDALGTARDPALSSRALALASDARLVAAERARLVRAQLAQPETRDAAWKTLQKRWDGLAPTLLGPDAEELPALARSLCDRERGAALRTFLEKRTEELPALSRRTPQAIAAIEACAALREAQGASAAAWFAGA